MSRPEPSTSQIKIGLLGCDDVPERFRHLGGTYRDMFERLLAPHMPGAQFIWFDIIKGELPPSPDACDAYICTGSRYSVYDPQEWIEQLKAFVRTLHERQKPFVGICFGHQVLAEALGGKVERSAKGWGIGVREMEVVQPEAWMQPHATHASLQYMHGDQVQTLPPGSTVLACAPHCEVAMFRVADTMLGIEGHPEFPASYAKALIEVRRERIGAALADEALAHVNDPTQHDIVGSWIKNFITRKKGSGSN
jgi:GMP synthase-like glutamine amidotransferase